MTTLDPRALKPCPHCGEAEELYPAYRLDKDGKPIEPPYAIDCLGCGTDFTPREGIDARAAWNRRALSQPQAGEPVPSGYGEFTPIQVGCSTASPPPANPSQVTDAMVEAASAKYREIGARCNWQHSWPSEEAFHEILTAAIGAGGQAVTFQQRVQPWMMACFGPEISSDKLERGDRLAEEVLELLQSGGYPRERIAALTDYVYGREIGEPSQEVGGVQVTLAAYCLAHDLDMHECGETELARVWTKVEKIRAKQAAKPTGSALPVAHPPHLADERVVEALETARSHIITLGGNPHPHDMNADQIQIAVLAVINAALSAKEGR